MPDVTEMTDDLQLENPESQPTGSPETGDGNVDKEELERLRRVVEIQSNQIGQLSQIQATAIAQQNAPPPPVEEPLPDREADPVAYVLEVQNRRMQQMQNDFKKQLEDQIKPIKDLSITSQRKAVFDGEVDRLKKKYPDVDPANFEELWEIGKNDFNPNNPQVVEQGLMLYLGQKAMSGKLSPKPRSEPNQESSQSFSPPNTPSNMPPRSGQQPPRRLTEADRKVMKQIDKNWDPNKPADVAKYFDYMAQDTRTYE